MIAQLQKVRIAFAADQRGSVAPIFGLVFSVLLLSLGMAVDYSRVTHANGKTLAAADAASLAGGKALLDGRLTDAQVRAITLKYFNENMNQGGKFGDISNVNVIVDRQSGLVKVDATTAVDMTVLAAANFNAINVPVTSSVLSEQKDIELGMALDLTGSMSGQKIVDLRLAAKDLVDILMPDGGTPNKVRIGLAPYAASVNAGGYARTVTNNLSNRCVHERGGPAAFTDAAPAAGTWLGTRNGLSCPNSTVQPLTEDKARLKANIDTYTANGSTAGHIGAAWASYLISPEWNFIWPAASRPVAYNDSKTLKAIVLMTDGEFNTQYLNGNGNSDTQARRICSETKNRDVVVYTIAFQSPAAAESLLRACASSPETYFSAQNGNELRQAFILIAQQLNSLRLTQ